MKKVALWVIGLFLLLIGCGALRLSILGGLLLISAGLLLIPLSKDALVQKFPITSVLNKGVVNFSLVAILAALGLITADSDPMRMFKSVLTVTTVLVGPFVVYKYIKWVRAFKVKTSRNKLQKSNHYEQAELDAMSDEEVILRSKLEGIFSTKNLSAYSFEQLQQEVANKNQSKGGFFSGLEKGIYGTNKKIRCINCGCRLRKGTFGGWSPAEGGSSCTKLSRSCVPIEEPAV